MNVESLKQIIKSIDNENLIKINVSNKNYFNINFNNVNEINIPILFENFIGFNLLPLWSSLTVKLIGNQEKSLIQYFANAKESKNSKVISKSNFKDVEEKIEQLPEKKLMNVAVKIYEKILLEYIKENLLIKDYDNVDVLNLVLNNEKKIDKNLVNFLIDKKQSVIYKHIKKELTTLSYSLLLMNIINENKNKIGNINFAYGEGVINHPMLNDFHNILTKNESEINKKLFARVYLESVFRLIENNKVDIKDEDKDVLVISHMKNSVVIYDLQNNDIDSYKSKNFNGHFLGSRGIFVYKINSYFNSNTFVELTGIEDLLTINKKDKFMEISYDCMRYTNAENYRLNTYINSVIGKNLLIEKNGYNNKTGNCILSSLRIIYNKDVSSSLAKEALSDLFNLIKKQIEDILFFKKELKDVNKERSELINAIRKIELVNELYDKSDKDSIVKIRKKI